MSLKKKSVAAVAGRVASNSHLPLCHKLQIPSLLRLRTCFQVVKEETLEGQLKIVMVGLVLSCALPAKETNVSAERFILNIGAEHLMVSGAHFGGTLKDLHSCLQSF